MSSSENPILERNLFGLYPAFVMENQDPENQGRVKVRLPWSPDEGRTTYENWARIATLMAGNQRGSWFIPDVGDEVIVGFQNGDPGHPIVLGMLWNGQDAPPERMDRDNNLKSLVSRTGIRFSMDDTEGDTKLILSTPGGQELILSDKDCTITISDCSGNTIRLDERGISVTAATKITVQTSMIEVAAASISVDAGLSRFSGVVQCDTLIANSVVKPT